MTADDRPYPDGSAQDGSGAAARPGGGRRGTVRDGRPATIRGGLRRTAVRALAAVVLLVAGAAAACGSEPADPGSPTTDGSSAPSAPASSSPGPMPRFMHGIFDDAWVKADGEERQAIVAEMAGKLHVDVVRIDLRWALAEPSAPGQYDEAYLGRLRDAVTTAYGAGMRVMIDVFAVPEWASDRTWWDKPLEGVPAGYQSYYPVAPAYLDAWEKTAAYLARYFEGKVAWWECWNEPNLWSYIYPQQTPDDDRFAAHRYMELLERFSRAVHEADPEAQVLGGVTAPFGMNDALRTAPQTFLAQIKKLGAAKYWDGVSHHPYTPAGVSPMPAPTVEPRFPEYSVTLGNISTLLEMFPEEPFYLTEYGYPTEPSAAWGTAFVSEPTQAAYVTAAFKYAATFEQVKLLNWFLWRDIDKGKDRLDSAFFGLKRANNTKKPSWYAFQKLH